MCGKEAPCIQFWCVFSESIFHLKACEITIYTSFLDKPLYARNCSCAA